MDENRISAYWQFLQKPLASSYAEQAQALNDHCDLLDAGLLKAIIVGAQLLHENGNYNGFNILINLALQLGEFSADIQRRTLIAKEIGDILLHWGIEQYNFNRFLVACQCWQQCLTIYQAIHHCQEKAIALGNLGNAYFSMADYKQALTYWEKTLDIMQAIKDRRRQVTALGNLGKAYLALAEYEQASNFFEQSLEICREIKDRAKEASLLLSLGIAYRYLGKHERALDCNEKSLVIYGEIGYRQGEAASRDALGITYNSIGKYKEAINYHKDSLAISRETEDRKQEATSLVNLGIVYNSLGEYKQAIDYYEESIAISQKNEDQQKKANSLIGLGNVYLSIGQYEQAIDYYNQSLDIKKNFRDQPGEATVLGNLGNAYLFLGKYEQGIDYHEQSLAIAQEIKYQQGQANSLGSLGNAYLRLEQHKLAISSHNDSLDICRQIKDLRGEATCRTNLGSAYCSLGEYEQAITYHKQSLAIQQEIKDRQGEAASLGNIGNAYLSLEEYELAIACYGKSLAICREIKYQQGEAAVLNNIAIPYRQLQQPEKAIENYRDSLKIAAPKTMPAECFKAGQNLGNLGFTQNNWQLALEGYEPAMQAVEQLRQGSTTDERRQQIIKDAISVYANAIQCYINLKQYDKAVETADRSRSRHLADLFYSSKDLYPKGQIPPEVEQYYRLQQQSNRLHISENDGIKAFATIHQATPNSNATLETIKELEAEKQKAWLKIRSKDQVLAGQLQADPLSFEQMRALIPDAETAILNFYTAGEHTHIFILRKDQAPHLHTCEGQGLETLQTWLYNHWLVPYFFSKQAATLASAKLIKRKFNDIESINVTAEPVIVKLRGGSEQKLDRKHFDVVFREMQSKMHKIWLNQMSAILPKLANRLQLNQLISDHLKDIKELIIIPHLYLHQIPFAALPLNNTPIPDSEGNSEKTRGLILFRKPSNTSSKTPPKQPEYLSDKFRIRIVPSCQILNFCHQRGNLKPATMGIVENATGDLVFTGYECETLATLHKIDQNFRLQYQQATIDNYQNLLNGVQVLHSSHHASFQLDNSLESKLHLFDGDINLGRVFTWRFLQLVEVFLSCCETNLSFTQITDDPLSLASGFLCAGARNVVSTLWAVDDLATALLCILYYQEKQDKSRSEALRQAQIKLRNLTGNELDARYKEQLEAYFEQQQWGENQTEIVKRQRLRLDLLCRQPLPFVSPYNWAGFVSQGLA